MNVRDIILILSTKRIIKIPDKTFLKLKYKNVFKKKLNIKEPKTFNEKLQWLKLYDRNPKYTNMVDKYEAKKYVANILGEEYIIPTLGIYNNFDEIDFDKLPNQFVIKCTHDSGGLVICRNKECLDIIKAKKKIEKSLKRNYYYCGREWPYKNVKPRIIIEKYLQDESGVELKDYKVLCFNGIAKYIELHCDRFGNHTQDIYDIEWNKTNIAQGPTSKLIYEKPKNLKLMLKLSEKLAKDIIHVRIDWYEVNGKLKFGEITFFDSSGFGKFNNYEDDKKLGDMINLKVLKEKNEN